ncbi:hypothetical protein RB597_005189 [Gaeumannomyces tritici]
MMMRPSVRTDMSVMERPRNSMDDQSTSGRLRSRLSGAAGSMVPVATGHQQVLRRRRSSITNDSELSVNTNAASAGGSEIGSPPRVNRPPFAPRRPKVTFPTSLSSSALQTLSRQSPEPTQNSQQQQHQHNQHQNQEQKKPARISLKPALKPSSSHPAGQHAHQHRPPIPPPPSSEAPSGPSTVSLTDSESMPTRRPGVLSFRPAQKMERPQLPSPPQSAGRLGYSMPGGWDELDESNSREEHNEMIRRRPAAHHHSLPSSPRHSPREIEYIPDSRRQSESDFSDTDLSETTEATTTTMSDTTVSYTQPSRKPKVLLPNNGNYALSRSNSNRDNDRRALAPQPPPPPARRYNSNGGGRPESPPNPRALERIIASKGAPPPPPRPAPSTRSEAGRRTLHIEVIAPPAPKETEEQVRRREEEIRRRERIEANLLDKIADLELQLQQEAESKMALIRARSPSPAKSTTREVEVAAAAAAAVATAEALASKEQLSGALERLSVMQSQREAEAQQNKEQLSGALERLSVMQAQREAEAQENQERLNGALERLSVMQAQREAEARENQERLNGALERLSVMQAERERRENHVQSLALARDQERSRSEELARRTEEMQYQIERQTKDLAGVRETLLEQSKLLEDRCALLTQAQLERDQARDSRIEAEARINILEQEVSDVRAAKSQSEIVTIERLAASELVREVLEIKVNGFEAEVKNKVMAIEDLTKERDELNVELTKSKAEVVVLTEEKMALQVAKADAEKRIAELEDDGSRMRVTIATLEGEKAVLETKVANVEEEIKNKQARVDDLEKATAEKDTQITTLTTEKNGLSTEVVILAAAKEEKEKELVATKEQNEKELAAAKEQGEMVVTALTNKITTIEMEKDKQLADAKEMTEKEVAAAKEANARSLAELQDKINAAEAEAAKIQAELKDLQDSTPEDYTAAVVRFGQEKDELADQVAALKAEVESKAVEADVRVAALAAEKAGLEAQKAALEAETRRIPELRDEAAAQSAALASRIALAQQQTAEAQAQQQTAMAEVQRMTAHVAALKTKIAEASKSRKEAKKKAKEGFFFVRPSQDRGRMQVMKKNELKEAARSSRSSSRNGAESQA